MEPISYILNGVVDYENPASGDRYVVAKLGDYYIGFNRRSGFNVGTLEAGNQVTVTQKLGSAESSTNSKLVGRLGVGQAYVIQIGSLLEVLVRYVRNDNEKDAIIEINVMGDLAECQGVSNAEISVEIRTDAYPSDTSWSITDALGQELYTRGGYLQSFTTFTVSYSTASVRSKQIRNFNYSTRIRVCGVLSFLLYRIRFQVFVEALSTFLF